MDRVVLHLGMLKTGTSLLQNSVVRFLAGRPDAGVLYPECYRGANIAHHELAEAVRNSSPDGIEDIAATFSASMLKEAESRTGVHMAFVSSESFANLCGMGVAKRLSQFLQFLSSGVPTESVIILRDFEGFFESMYLQSARFGHARSDFPDYLRARRRWLQDLCDGLEYLSESLGSDFVMKGMDDSFDVIDYFSRKLVLPAAELQKVADGVPSTAKRTLKEQAALMFLPYLEEDLGYSINRRKLVDLFSSGFTFEDDVQQFTIFDSEAAREYETLLQAIMPHPIYRSHFAKIRDRATGVRPPYKVVYDHLSANDLDRLKGERPRIEANTDPSQ